MGHFGHLLVVALAVLGISEANQNSRFRRATKKTDTKVKSLHVESKVMSRFATTHVRSEVHNLKAEAQEIFFEAQLPSEAFISNFTMEIDGRLEVAEVKGKEEAAKKYQEAKASGNTAGLVAQKPRETDIFRTSVNVKAKRKVKFDLTYQEVLVRRHGVYKHVVNVLSTEGIEDVEIKVIISERGKLSKLKVPKFAPKIAVKTNKELLALPDNSEATVRSSESEGVSTTSVSYEPARGKAGQLAVLYDVERSTQGGEIEVVDGFFVHFIAPQADFIDSVSADFVFVLDASGSMDGRKFSQMQEAMRTILPQLKEEDKFSLVYFSNKMTTWKQELQQAEEDNVDEALEFIENQESGGGTNIHGALLEAMQILDRSSERKRPAVIVFLTDGHPTVGEIQDAEGIKRAIKQRNRKSYRIHSLAFGDDADSTMLKQLSKENTGLFRKIFVASDAALQLDGFYSEISVPLFSNLKVTYLNSSVKTESVIKNRDDDTLYEGSEIVIVGKMKRKTVQTLKGQISAKQSDGQPVVFRCGNECFHCCNRICPSFCGPRPRCIPPLPPPIPVVKVSAAELPPNTLGGIIERMWAYQTIKKKLLNAELNPSKASKLKREAKNLAIQYNFVTELTSLVIVDKEAELKPTEDAEEEADQFMGMGGGSRGPGRFGMAGGSSFGGRISPTMVSMGSLAGPRGPSGFGGRGSSINRQKGLFGLPAPKSMTRRPRPRPTRRPRPSATWRTSSVPTSTLPTTTPPTTLATSNVPCPLNIIVLIDSRPGSRISSKKSEIFRAFSAKLRNSVKIDGEIALAYLTSDGGNIDVRSLSRINTSQSKSARGESLRNVIRSFKRQKGDFYVVVLHGRKMLPSSLKKLLQAQSSDSIVSAQLRQDSTSTGKMTEVARLSSIALFGADANKLYKKIQAQKGRIIEEGRLKVKEFESTKIPSPLRTTTTSLRPTKWFRTWKPRKETSRNPGRKKKKKKVPNRKRRTGRPRTKRPRRTRARRTTTPMPRETTGVAKEMSEDCLGCNRAFDVCRSLGYHNSTEQQDYIKWFACIDPSLQEWGKAVGTLPAISEEVVAWVGESGPVSRGGCTDQAFESEDCILCAIEYPEQGFALQENVIKCWIEVRPSKVAHITGALPSESRVEKSSSIREEIKTLTDYYVDV